MTLKYSLKCKKVKKKGAVDKSVCLALWFMAEPTQEESHYKKKSLKERFELQPLGTCFGDYNNV